MGFSLSDFHYSFNEKTGRLEVFNDKEGSNIDSPPPGQIAGVKAYKWKGGFLEGMRWLFTAEWARFTTIKVGDDAYLVNKASAVKFIKRTRAQLQKLDIVPNEQAIAAVFQKILMHPFKQLEAQISAPRQRQELKAEPSAVSNKPISAELLQQVQRTLEGAHAEAVSQEPIPEPSKKQNSPVKEQQEQALNIGIGAISAHIQPLEINPKPVANEPAPVPPAIQELDRQYPLEKVYDLAALLELEQQLAKLSKNDDAYPVVIRLKQLCTKEIEGQLDKIVPPGKKSYTQDELHVLATLFQGVSSIEKYPFMEKYKEIFLREIQKLVLSSLKIDKYDEMIAIFSAALTKLGNPLSINTSTMGAEKVSIFCTGIEANAIQKACESLNELMGRVELKDNELLQLGSLLVNLPARFVHDVWPAPKNRFLVLLGTKAWTVHESDARGLAQNRDTGHALSVVAGKLGKNMPLLEIEVEGQKIFFFNRAAASSIEQALLAIKQQVDAALQRHPEIQARLEQNNPGIAKNYMAAIGLLGAQYPQALQEPVAPPPPKKAEPQKEMAPAGAPVPISATLQELDQKYPPNGTYNIRSLIELEQQLVRLPKSEEAHPVVVRLQQLFARMVPAVLNLFCTDEKTVYSLSEVYTLATAFKGISAPEKYPFMEKYKKIFLREAQKLIISSEKFGNYDEAIDTFSTALGKLGNSIIVTTATLGNTKISLMCTPQESKDIKAAFPKLNGFIDKKVLVDKDLLELGRLLSSLPARFVNDVWPVPKTLFLKQLDEKLWADGGKDKKEVEARVRELGEFAEKLGKKLALKVLSIGGETYYFYNMPSAASPGITLQLSEKLQQKLDIVQLKYPQIILALEQKHPEAVGSAFAMLKLLDAQHPEVYVGLEVPVANEELVLIPVPLDAAYRAQKEVLLKGADAREPSSQQVAQFIAALKQLSPTFDHLIGLYNQLQTVFSDSFEKVQTITAYGILKIAELLVSEQRVEGVAARHFGKQHGLMRSVVVQGEHAYVLAQKKISVVQGKGAFKKATNVALVSLKNLRPPVMAVSAFTQKSSDVREAEVEAAQFQKMKGKPGVVQLLGNATYQFRPNGLGVPSKRANFIFEKFQGDLGLVWTTPRAFTPSQQLQIAKGVIYGMHSLHSEGYLHLDAKPANFYFRKENATVIAKVGDLGTMTKMPNKGEKIVKTSTFYNEGSYGTPTMSAPELLGEANFTGDHAKIDVYALGLSLYVLATGETPLWILDSMKCANLRKDRKDNRITEEQYQKATKEAKAEMVQKIDRAIYAILPAIDAKLKAGVALTEAESLQYIACMCMQSDPAKRFDMAQAKEAIDRALPNFQVA